MLKKIVSFCIPNAIMICSIHTTSKGKMKHNNIKGLILAPCIIAIIKTIKQKQPMRIDSKESPFSCFINIKNMKVGIQITFNKMYLIIFKINILTLILFGNTAFIIISFNLSSFHSASSQSINSIESIFRSLTSFVLPNS